MGNGLRPSEIDCNSHYAVDDSALGRAGLVFRMTHRVEELAVNVRDSGTTSNSGIRD